MEGEVATGLGETADPQGARANRRRYPACKGARVARIAKCRLEQEMGYAQHTTNSQLHTTESGVFPVLWEMRKNGLSEHTIRFVRKALIVIEKGCGFEDPDRV